MDARGALRPASDMLQLVLMITVDIGRVDHIFNRRARARSGASPALEVCLWLSAGAVYGPSEPVLGVTPGDSVCRRLFSLSSRVFEALEETSTSRDKKGRHVALESREITLIS